ncbi:ParD-like family protein [Agarivorans sp. Z349TD_8]|uniref:ParD-like family protein n=1 Tax=Agarivorans sp. Z349TD_8 TaxID=3421434 RepID=UPI003D7E24E1
MGIVKISEELHQEIRKASSVMSRSINSQAEFWIRIGMLAELHPQRSFNQIVSELLKSAEVSVAKVAKVAIQEAHTDE